jgi:hypothetical protein
LAEVLVGAQLMGSLVLFTGIILLRLGEKRELVPVME